MLNTEEGLDKREQFAVSLRKIKKEEILSKKRVRLELLTSSKSNLDFSSVNTSLFDQDSVTMRDS